MAGWALVVDGGAALRAEPAVDLHVVPLHVEVEGRLLEDGSDIDADEVYARLARGESLRTSTPSPGAYLSAFRAARAPRILCLTMAGQLSGMHEAARLAARLLAAEGDPRPVDVVDTGTAAAGLALVARAAARLLRAGAGVDEVAERLEQATGDVRMIGAMRTLRHLARSGRVPSVAAYAGSLLRVRPLFEMRRGEVLRRGVVRGDGRLVAALAQAALRSRGGDTVRPLWLIVCHAGEAELAAELRRAIAATLPVAQAETLALSPVIGAYTGPGMVGFAHLPLAGRELPGD